jgi:hypothetical protein
MIGGVLSYAWPVVLTLALLWGPDRRRLGLLVIGYFGILLAFCTRTAFSETPPVDVLGSDATAILSALGPYGDAGGTAAVSAPVPQPTRAGNRSGPAVLIIIVGIGGEAAMVGFSTYAGMTVKQLMPFLGYQMPFLSLWLQNFEVVNVIAMLLFLPLGWLAITFKIKKWVTASFLNSSASIS